MEKNPLELRMYFLTIYQLTGIQAGIQCGHAAIEYARQFGDSEEFKDFANNWKTWIILNGGTTNDRRDFDSISMGSLNQIADSLVDNDIKFSYFQEPDLNDALTAVCFIADERVFNKKDYPDFIDHLVCKLSNENEIVNAKLQSIDFLKEAYQNSYKEWIRLIGGVKNEFLRELLSDKKLA